MFTWMAIDRANVSGVLTSTFLKDTGITRDQANTGVSLLWLGIVLLEIPSNVNFRMIPISTPCLANSPSPGRSASHWTPYLDPRTGHRLGPRRNPAVLRHWARGMVRRTSVPRPGGERLPPGGSLHTFAVVHAGRDYIAHVCRLFWLVCGVCFWLIDLLRGAPAGGRARHTRVAMVSLPKGKGNACVLGAANPRVAGSSLFVEFQR